MKKLTDLSDIAAESECRRLLIVVNARRKRDNAWFNYDEAPIVYDDDSAFVVGMKSLFRYARGESIPPFVVRDYLSLLLDLLFAGIASGALALPSFRKMGDRPWAHAWRRAEIRMAFETDDPMPVSQMAHLLGISVDDLRTQIATSTDGAFEGDIVPRAFLDRWLCNAGDDG